MKIIIRTIALLFLLFCSTMVIAQDQKVEMADGMRSSGRIYVVIAVMLTILIGLIIYLVRLDKKISNLEKQK